MTPRRTLAAVALVLPAAGRGQSTAWPTRPVRVLVPFAPGASSDLVARQVCARLARELGGTLVVENRPGAGGLLAAQVVARGAPDGTLLLFGGPGVAVGAALQRDPGFDPDRDFTPVLSMVANPALLVVPAARPWRSVAELAAAARAQAGGFTYGSGGVGTPAHLAAAAMAAKLDMPVTHVPYRGANEAALAVARGEVDFAFAIVNITLPQVDAGVFRPLLLSGHARSARLPGVPAMPEVVPDLPAILSWNMLLGPAGVPAGVAEALHAAWERALEDGAFVTALTQDGGEITRYAGPAALLAAWREELPRQRRLLAMSGAGVQ